MSVIKLKVVNNHYSVLLTFKNNLSVFNLKEKICNLDVFNSVNNLDSNKCNLFYVRKCQLLENDKHLEYYKFEDYDEIILSIPNRAANVEIHETIDYKITDKDIEEATRNLEGKNLKILNEKSKPNIDRVLRSVLITLIEVSQSILCLNKTASDLFQYVQREISNHRDQFAITADQNLINTLMEMGISQEKACSALVSSNNSLNNALNLIFSQSASESNEKTKVEADEWITMMRATWCDTREIASVSPMKHLTPLHYSPLTIDLISLKIELQDANHVKGIQDISIKSITDENGDIFVKPMPTKVILKLYRDYNRKFFRPHVAIRERLIDMGFVESTVNEALRINNNNELAAVDSLLNPSSLVIDLDDENDIDGLPFDHELITMILANPDIQLGLLNIYSLLAFLNIVDNPKNWSHWLANPETKSILQQISNIVTDFVSSF